MSNKVQFRTPLKKLRLLIGALCWLFSALPFFSIYLQPQKFAVPLAIALGFILAGLAIAFGERICEVDAQKKTLCSYWGFMNFRATKPMSISLAQADAVKLALVQKLMDYDPNRVIRADKAFPVWIMQGQKALAHVIGWKQPKDPGSSRGEWDTGMFNSAWYPEYARYVAATCAKLLNLPLVDQMNSKIISPDEIPQDWLDASKVRFKLKWESETREL